MHKNSVKIAVIAFTAFTGMAQAGTYTPQPANNISPYPTSPGNKDWTGMYGDVYAGHWFSGVPGNYLGFNLGYLTGNGSMVYGGELGYVYDPSASYSQFTIDGRVGVPAGVNTLLFANLGLGRDSAAFNFVEYSVGGQYAFTNSIYARGEVVGQTAFGGGGSKSSVRLGVGVDF